MGGEDVDGSLEVVCDGGEVDLDGGFREAAPSGSGAQGDLPATDRSADGNIGYAHEMRHRHSQGSG